MKTSPTNTNNNHSHKQKEKPDTKQHQNNSQETQYQPVLAKKVTPLRIFVSSLIGIASGILIGSLFWLLNFFAIEKNGDLGTALGSFATAFLISILAGFLIFVSVLIYSILIIKKPKIAKKFLILSLIIISLGLMLRVLVIQSNNRIIQIYNKNQAAIKAAQLATIRPIYQQTANQDAAILFSTTPGANQIYKSTVSNTGLSTNEVNTIYCYIVPSINASSIISGLISGLNKIPVYNGPLKLYHSANGDVASDSYSSDNSFLQEKFMSTNKIDMNFTISGNSVSNYTNGKSDYSGVHSLKTSNPNYYPQANIDIKINIPPLNIDKCSLPASTTTQGSLLVTAEFDLADNPAEIYHY
jgi:hypothetical protein